MFVLTVCDINMCYYNMAMKLGWGESGGRPLFIHENTDYDTRQLTDEEYQKIPKTIPIIIEEHQQKKTSN